MQPTFKEVVFCMWFILMLLFNVSFEIIPANSFQDLIFQCKRN